MSACCLSDAHILTCSSGGWLVATLGASQWVLAQLTSAGYESWGHSINPMLTTDGKSYTTYTCTGLESCLLWICKPLINETVCFRIVLTSEHLSRLKFYLLPTFTSIFKQAVFVCYNSHKSVEVGFIQSREEQEKGRYLLVRTLTWATSWW